jgi:hypothetical protein
LWNVSKHVPDDGVTFKKLAVFLMTVLKTSNFALEFLLTKYVIVVGRSRDRFLVVSLDFSVTYSFRPHHGPKVNPAPSENEYLEHFLGVMVASA